MSDALGPSGLRIRRFPWASIDCVLPSQRIRTTRGPNGRYPEGHIHVSSPPSVWLSRRLSRRLELHSTVCRIRQYAASDSMPGELFHRDIGSTYLDEPTDRDQLIVKNIVSLLQTRVPGLESRKASTIRLLPLEDLRSRMLLRCGYLTRPSGFSSCRRHVIFLAEHSGCDTRPADAIRRSYLVS